MRPAAGIAALRAEVKRRAMASSPRLASGNFEAISTADLQLLLSLYDELFFARCFVTALEHPIRFRLSRAMRSAFGKTSYPAPRGPFTITIAAQALFENFRPGDRELREDGFPLKDRLDGLMIILEHEIVHVIESFFFGASSCRAARFAGLAGGLFGHTRFRGDFITRAERVFKEHGFKAGDSVEFEIEGRTWIGRITNINRYATVMIEDPVTRERYKARVSFQYLRPAKPPAQPE